jgi:hypothetical protein
MSHKIIVVIEKKLHLNIFLNTFITIFFYLNKNAF